MFIYVIRLYFFLLFIIFFKFSFDKLLHEFGFYHFYASFALFLFLSRNGIWPFKFLFLNTFFAEDGIYVNSSPSKGIWRLSFRCFIGRTTQFQEVSSVFKTLLWFRHFFVMNEHVCLYLHLLYSIFYICIIKTHVILPFFYRWNFGHI